MALLEAGAQSQVRCRSRAGIDGTNLVSFVLVRVLLSQDRHAQERHRNRSAL